MNIVDLTSKTFRHLTVLYLTTERSSDGSRIWVCRCSCGNIGKYAANKLRYGKSKQCAECGIKNKSKAGTPPLDLTNLRVGRLVAIERTQSKAGDGSFIWVCKCDCGNEVKLSTSILKSGLIVSCGCYRAEMAGIRQTTHGMSNSITYRSWIHMKDRVINENHENFHRYGGRGITICERWLTSFENFLQDMGIRPSEEYSIDRINSDGNYEPGNCKWSTDKEQARNKANTVRLSYNGVQKSIDDWVDELKLSKPAVYSRYRQGLSHAECLFGKGNIGTPQEVQRT